MEEFQMEILELKDLVKSLNQQSKDNEVILK
jgi:hypothetical protein